MSFGERIKFRRGELKLSRGELAGRLGVSPSAVSNYENGLSFPKEDVMLRLFDSLETDPNQLFRDSFRGGGQALSSEEQTLLRKFRELSPLAMAPYLEDGAVAYVSRTPLREGDVGIFSVNGKVLCRQYDRDDSGTVYLFSLNRRRADGDVTLPAAEAGTLICFGRVLTGTLSNRN